MTRLGGQIEAGVHFGAHREETTVGTLKVEVVRTHEVEIAGKEVNGRRGLETQGWFKHVVHRSALSLRVSGGIGRAGRGLTGAREGRDVLCREARDRAKARSERIFDGAVDLALELLTYGWGASTRRFGVKRMTNQIRRCTVVGVQAVGALERVAHRGT